MFLVWGWLFQTELLGRVCAAYRAFTSGKYLGVHLLGRCPQVISASATPGKRAPREPQLPLLPDAGEACAAGPRHPGAAGPVPLCPSGGDEWWTRRRGTELLLQERICCPEAVRVANSLRPAAPAGPPWATAASWSLGGPLLDGGRRGHAGTAISA